MAIFGPFVKGAAVVIFLWVFRLSQGWFQTDETFFRQLGIFYMLVCNSLALVAVSVDQIIV